MKRFSKVLSALALCGAVHFGFSPANVEAAEISGENQVTVATESLVENGTLDTQNLYGPPPPPNHRRHAPPPPPSHQRHNPPPPPNHHPNYDPPPHQGHNPPPPPSRHHLPPRR